MRPDRLFAAIWIAWGVTWLGAAVWSGRTEKRAATWDVSAYRLLTVVGAILLWHGTARVFGSSRLWHVGYGGAYALAGVTLTGIGFAWWARLHLGRLWSGSVTVKEGHRIVDTGPYSLVRHPIYTGLIGATLATAAAPGTATAVVGWALVTLGLWLKARVEERFLVDELGSESYGAYQRRVPMLVPFTARSDCAA
jgi:protein-S-isoprenylcysteine O-methyltransferase Ste14